MEKNYIKASKVVALILALVSVFGKTEVTAQDYHWVGNYYYYNQFTTEQNLNDWLLTEALGTGSWHLSGNGTAQFEPDNSLFYFYSLSMVKSGNPYLLPLNKANGSIELNVTTAKGNQWFSLVAEEYNASGVYLSEKTLISQENKSGNFTINLNSTSWNSAATQIRFVINGFSVLARNAVLEIDYFNYKHNDPSWNNPLNWSATAGGAGGLGVPSLTSNVIFDQDRPIDCTINVPASIKSISISSGYSGTITQGINSITIKNSATLSGGTFNGGSGAIIIGGTATIDGTAFKSTSGTLELDGNFAFTQGSFTHNNGNVVFNGNTPNNTITGTSPVYYNVEFAGKNQDYQIQTSNSITVLNTLSITGTQPMNLNSGNIDVKGNMMISNTGWNAHGNSVVNISGTGNQIIEGTEQIGQASLGGLTINKTSGTLTLKKNISINNNLTITSGQVDAGTSTLSIARNLTLNGGVFTANASTISLSGNLVNNATLNAGTSTIQFNGTSAISGTAITTLNNIIIDGQLTVPATLNVTGDFTNNKTFLNNGGTIVFAGTKLQKIQGTATSDFKNIRVTNTAVKPGLTFESNANLFGVLTLSANVHVDADGTAGASVLTLRSNGDSPTQDAAIGILPSSAKVLGNVTVERYMSIEGYNNTNIYRYISSPITNATVADIQNEIPITGSFTGTSTCSGCSKNQSMFQYDETVINDANKDGVANLNDGYVDFPQNSNSEILVPGKGYAMYVLGSKLKSATWNVRGTINQATSAFTFPVTRTSSGTTSNDGWNLVGNPFPSTIDWNASGWTKTNIQSTIYVRDNGGPAAQFAAWNGVTGTNGGSRYIAMGQAFWVKATTGTPSLKATENVKAAGVQTSFFKESAPTNLIRITLAKGTVRDEAVVHFREDATDGVDELADATKMFNGTFNLSTLTNEGDYLAINSLPSSHCSVSVPLSIDYATTGDYHLDFSEFESFVGHPVITLIDNFTGARVNVIETNSYTFSITSNAASTGKDRFVLSFSESAAAPLELSTSAVCSATDALVTLSNSQTGITYAAFINNNIASDTIEGNGSKIQFSIPSDLLTSKENNVVVKSLSSGCSAPSQESVIVNVEQLPSVTTVDVIKACQAGEVVLKAQGAPQNGSYNWYTSADATQSIEQAHDSLFTTPYLTKSKTYFVAAVNALGCEGERHEVKAEVTSFDVVQIETKGDSLMSTYTVGNQWYFNDELLNNETTAGIRANQTGTYSVVVNVNGCSTSASFEFIVTGVEPQAEFNVQAYPNPVVDYITIEAPSSVTSQVVILNSAGQRVGQTSLQELNGKQVGQFSFSALPSGIYFASVGGKQIRIAKR